MYYSKGTHHRKSIRLKGYDYSQKGLYFITICTRNRIHLFGKIKNGKMILNKYGEIAQEEWEKTLKIRKNINLGQFIIMPDHFHSIIHIEYKIENNKDTSGKFKSPSQTIGAIIRGYKGATTKRINTISNRMNQCTGVLQYAPTEDHFLKEESSPSFLSAPTEDHFLKDESSPSFLSAPTEDHFLKDESSSIENPPHLKNPSIWQRNYWEHIIRNKNEYLRISNYIKNNPANWQKNKKR